MYFWIQTQVLASEPILKFFVSFPLLSQTTPLCLLTYVLVLMETLCLKMLGNSVPWQVWEEKLHDCSLSCGDLSPACTHTHRDVVQTRTCPT